MNECIRVYVYVRTSAHVCAGLSLSPAHTGSEIFHICMVFFHVFLLFCFHVFLVARPECKRESAVHLQ